MLQTRSQFVSRYGGIYEHSAWVAEQCYEDARDIGASGELAELLAKAVDRASDEQKLELIRAHPDLAGKAAVAGSLTEESTEEQAAAGIDRCTAGEFEHFQSLNSQYKNKFGFPFVMAVRNSNKTDILQAFATWLENDYATEFATAIREIHKIAGLRLNSMDGVT
jgi:2-oxo-4-hydroxy-4-carboxy-5-ureidoimidazoline decarboxylase